MKPFTFIHAADLHLDAIIACPPGIVADEPKLKNLLAEAVFIALERLVELCLTEQSAFLILAGDLYNAAEGSLRARHALYDACVRLKANGIQVFWARGNHDPASENWSGINWPDNLHIFKTEAECLPLKNGADALVHGISHADSRVTENLSLLINSGQLPLMEHDLFRLAALHCAVGGSFGRHANYAPCSLGDLTRQKIDYWALGHVHQPAILSETPLVAYPGSLQGLHINESGPHGCYLVQVDGTGLAKARFRPLAPLRWEKIKISMPELEAGLLRQSEMNNNPEENFPDKQSEPDLLQLEAFILEALKNMARTVQAEATAFAPIAVFCRVELSGRTMFDRILRQADSLGTLVERLNSSLEATQVSEPILRVRDIQLSTQPDINFDQILQNENLVGETLREAVKLEQKLRNLITETGENIGIFGPEAPEWFAPYHAALNELYGSNLTQRLLEPLSVNELVELVQEATALCMDLFEAE